MTELDIGRFVRLKAAIDGTLKVESSVMAASALADAQERYRINILSILPAHLRQEFEALFPPRSATVPSGRGLVSADPLRAAGIADQARERLLGMAGWLEGVVQSQET